MAEEVEVLVEGGKASAGPPIGPALGPHGLNVVEVVNEINKLTKEFEGMKVPVKIIIDSATKSFKLKVGTPPASALIMKQADIEKGASDLAAAAGNISMSDVVSVAKMKQTDLLGRTLKEKAKEIIGTCVSMNVTVEETPPKEMLKRVDSGEFDQLFAE